MTDLKSGYQLLSGKRNAIFVLIALLVLIPLFLLWQALMLEQTITQKYLPAIVQQEQHQQVILQSEQLIKKIGSNRENNEAIKGDYQALQTLLKRSQSQAIVGRKFYPLLDNTEVDNLVERLANNEVRNLGLTQQASEHIKVIDHALIDLLAVMSDRQANLYNQVLADRVSDRVTASRARAHTNVSHDIQDYQAAHRHLNQISLLLSELNYLSEPGVIDQLDAQAELFVQWKNRYQEQLQSESDELQTALEALNLVLFGDTRLIAKWRGQVRLSNEYLAVLSSQQEQLQQLSQINDKVIEQPQLRTQQWLSDYSIDINQTQFYTAVAGLLGLLAIIALIIQRSLVQQVRKQELATQVLVETVILDQEGEVQTREHAAIAEQLTQVTKPEHDESAYQLLQQNLEEYQWLMVEHSRLFVFDGRVEQLSHASIALLNQVSGLSLVKEELTSWRRFLSLDQQQQIIHELRAIQEGDNTIDASCFTLDFSESNQLTVIAVKTDHAWRFTVQDSSLTRQQTIEQNAQITQSKTSERLSFQALKRIFQHVQQQVIGLSINSHNPKKLDKPAIKRGQQLAQLMNWAQGGEYWAQAQLDAHPTTFTSANLANAISAAVLSAKLEKEQAQHISFEHLELEHLHLGDVEIKTDLAVFTYVLSNLIDIQKVAPDSQLALKTKIVDQNSGQLKVRYQFNYQQQATLGSLPSVMLLLSHQVERQPKTLNFDTAYFVRVLLDYLHVDKIELTQSEHGWQFSFELPHSTTTALESVSSDSVPSLKTCVLIIGQTQEKTAWLQSLLKLKATEVIVVSDVERAKSMLEAQRLEKKKIGVVIGLFEPSFDQTHQIKGLINQLPERLRPRLVALAEHDQFALNKQDLFGWDARFSIGLSLLQHLKAQLASDAPSNLLMAHNQVSSTQYVASNINVLLVSENVAQCHGLVTLLHWFGFEVCVESQLEQAKSRWQSGLYRILVSTVEFDGMTEFRNKKASRRLVIGLSPLSADATEYTQVTHIESWFDFNLWQSLLAPWLTKKEDKGQIQRPEKVEHKSTQTVEDVQPAQLNQDTQFDLERFASNVGGVEIAALVIDDYLEEAQQLVKQLTYSLSVKSHDHSEEHIVRLIQIGRVIASDELVTWGEQLAHCIEQQAYQEAGALLVEVERDVLGIQSYAQAI